MNYSQEEVLEYIEQEEVKFVRLAFCDIFGRQKNIAIMPYEIKRAFSHGIPFEASAVTGFSQATHSDLFLYPIPSTLTTLPWRSMQGKVVRLFCEIRYPDGTPFENDSRAILERATKAAAQEGISVVFGSEYEFYLFEADDHGKSSGIPFDEAGYLDVAPDDRGENIRREICITLDEMGIRPESSHHEEGPSQNEIDFHCSDALSAADNAMNLLTVVKSIALINGLYADFSPKPLENEYGNGLHLNISLDAEKGEELLPFFMAGILEHIKEVTAFLNPVEESYKRLGQGKAPCYISWSPQNYSQLMRTLVSQDENPCFELRSPDPLANPYLAFALLIHAGLDGIRRKIPLQPALEIDFLQASEEQLQGLDHLPNSLSEAVSLAKESAFIAEIIPHTIIESLGLSR